MKTKKTLEKFLAVLLTFLLTGVLQLGLAVPVTLAGQTTLELAKSGTFSLKQGDSQIFNVQISVPDKLTDIPKNKGAVVQIPTSYTVSVIDGSTNGTASDISNQTPKYEFYNGNSSYSIPVTISVSRDAKPGSYKIKVGSLINNHDQSFTLTDTTDDYITVTVVNVAPTINLDQTPKPWTNDGGVSFSWIGSDYDTPSAELLYSWKLNDGAWSTYSNATSTSFNLSQGNYTFTVKVKDSSGTESVPATYTFGVDTEKPVVTATEDRGANAKGWYNDNVVVSFDATDNLSGIDKVDPPATISTEGANQEVIGSAVDKAGNVGKGSTSISIDKTPPTISISGIEDGGVYDVKQNVTVTWSTEDLLSGVSNDRGTLQSGALIDTDSIGTKQFSVNATDFAGNEVTKTIFYEVKDISAPAVVLTKTPGAWSQDGTASFIWTGTDNYNDSSEIQYSWQLDQGDWSVYAIDNSVTLNNLSDGSHTLSIKAKDTNGNESVPIQHTFGVDSISPEVTVGVDREPNTNGWYNSDVIVSFSAKDTGSGIAAFTQPFTVTQEGAEQKIEGSATDNAGNTSYGNAVVNLDKTAPKITINGVKDSDVFELNKQVTATWTAEDTLSGLANAVGTVPSGSAIDTSTVGTKQFVVTATDEAGNTNTQSITYNVVVTGPKLIINGPSDNLETSAASITISGQTQVGCNVTINGIAVYPDYNGNFLKAFSLNPGTNVFTIVTKDSTGKTTTVTRTVKRPVVILNGPANNLQTNNNSVVVNGTAAIGSNVLVNGQKVALDTKGNFSITVNLQVGINIIAVSGTDAYGYNTNLNLNVYNDITPPNLTLTGPTTTLETSGTSVTISGQTEVGSTVKINGIAVYPDYNGNFLKAFGLNPGTNIFTITSTDPAGNVTTVSRTVRRPVVILNSPSNNLQTNKSNVVVSGVAAIGANVTVNNQSVNLDSKGNFSTTVNLQLGNNVIAVSGTDSYLYTTNLTVGVTYDITPPDLTLSGPNDNLQTSGLYVTVSGQTEVGSVVKINSTQVYPNENGLFVKSISLSSGLNVLTITATDPAGNVSTVIRSVNRS